uniref:ANK_REP_REGION domain-containing protein n=1 Tax=Macrostomum lignano TaxID=282301 RepID=A0A1I8FF06_9PLAT
MGSLSRAYESPSLLRELLAAGSVSPNSELDSSLGWRLLHKAAADNRCDVLSVLISSHRRRRMARQQLDLALARKSLEALQLLLEEGANANGGANTRSKSTVHAAVRIRKDDRFLHLLLDHGASCGTFDQHGDLPIHRACLEENVRAAQLLLSHNPHLGFTPLHIAANLGNSKLFLTVLRSGPRLDLYDIQERTPIDIVLAKQDTAILEGMGQWMVPRAQQRCIKELLAMRQGQQFLRLLRTVDTSSSTTSATNEWQRGDEPAGQQHQQHAAHAHPLQREVRTSTSFVEIVLKACMTRPWADEIISGGMVGKIADKLSQAHLRGPQNEALLQEVMKLGMLWSAVVVHLENRNCSRLTTKAWATRKDGIQGPGVRATASMMKAGGSAPDERRRRGRPGHHACRQEPPHLKAMRGPRHCCWPKPCAASAARRDIEDVYATGYKDGPSLEAHRHAGPSQACKDVDVTPNNCLTMELVMLPLRHFGGYSMLGAGGKGESQQLRAEPDVVQRLLLFRRKDAHQGALIEAGHRLRLRAAAVPCSAVPVCPAFRASSTSRLRVLACRPSSHQRVIRERDGRCRRMRSAPEAPASRAWRCCRRPEAAKAAEEEEQQPRPRLSPLAELLRFVLLLSFVVMFRWAAPSPSGRIICYLTLLGFLVEEINEMITSAREETIKNYFLDGWNVIDITAITCGFTAFALRIHNSTVHNPFQRYWSLVLLTTTCLVYWVRLLYISVVLESLGPKLKMMSLMVKKDFLPFLFILFVLMFGFGVTFHALQYPEGKSIQSTGTEGRESASEIILGMFRNTFYAIVGEYGLDNFVPCNISDITGPNINDGDEPDCVHPIGAVLVPTVYMVLYIVVMQILLLNVIVAMFSKTIDAIDSESKPFREVRPYRGVQHQVGAAPPFNILSELRNLASFVWRRLCRRSGAARAAAAAVVAAEAAANSAAPASAGDTPHDCKALAFRNAAAVPQSAWCWTRRTWTKATRVIFQQVNALNERWRDSTALKMTVKQHGVAGQGAQRRISLRGPSNISNKRASVLAMPYIEEGREEGP